MKDYPRWEDDEEEVKESASKAKKQIPTQESQPTRKPDVSVYEAYDEFQEKHEIPENDESFFYGAAFDDFNKEWQGLDAGAGSVSTEFGTTNNSTDAEPYNEDELDELLDNNSSTVPVQNKPFPSPAEYRKLSLDKRAKLLPPPSDDRIEELKKYRAEDVKLIKELKLRPKDEEYITKTEIKTKDSLVNKIETEGSF